MKIVFAGGGTGGHFYPIIAVAEAIRDIASERHLLAPQLYYIGPVPYDEQALFANGITYIKGRAGKVRRYASLQNFFDLFATLWGTLESIIILLKIYPDVVFSKGGYASVPVVLAARVLGIPIVIHESDSKPGRANLLAAKFATRIAIAFESAAAFFPEKSRTKIALTGIPLRKELMYLDPEGGLKDLALDPAVPTVLVLGGSSGSTTINESVVNALPDLLPYLNVIHQTGKANLEETQKLAKLVAGGHPNESRYHVFPFLSATTLREAAGAAHVIVSRAGATSIAEIALWRRPAVLIPIPEPISHDQRTNAYAYAKTGAAEVIEQQNLTPHLLASEVRRIAEDGALGAKMASFANAFGSEGAARAVAEELLKISLGHEETQTT